MTYRLSPKTMAAAAIVGILPFAAGAQLAGRTAADGPFLIDDFEDLNLVTPVLQRNWLVTVIISQPQGLDIDMQSPDLAPDQTPIGAIQPRFPDDNAFIFGSPNSAFGSFGVPMPGLPGVSTDPNAGGVAGDITSFETLTFLNHYSLFGSQQSTAITASVTLECYPGNPDGTFPTLIYDFTPASGSAFQPQTIDLRAPTEIAENPSELTVEQLLGQTRYLSYFFLATPVGEPSWLTVSVDDIVLTGPETDVDDWMLYSY